MVLCIDIGNTNTTLGVFEAETLLFKFNLETHSMLNAENIALQLKNHQMQLEDIQNVALCSVVKSMDKNIEDIFKHANILNITSDCKTNIQIPYRKLGVDRIANAAYAHKLYRENVIIVDFGTATTFCLLRSTGEHLGGMIICGVDLFTNSLAYKSNAIPKTTFQKPTNDIGKNTAENLISGSFYGYLGAIENIITTCKTEQGFENAKVIACGGESTRIFEYLNSFDILDPDLTLKGINYIYTNTK